MTAARPDLSVLIAAFNCAGFIGRAIESALNQRGVTLEVLVVDDASTDGTRRAVAQLASAEPRVKLIGLKRNGGPSAARNAGIAAARGEWIAVLDADDAYEPGRLARLVGLGRSFEADMVADNFRYFDIGRMTAVGNGLALADAPELIDRYAYLRGARPLTGEADFGLLKPLFRRRFLEEHGLGYPADMRHGEDFEFYLEILLAGGRFVLSRVPGYLYTLRSSGLSRTVPDYSGQLVQLARLMRRPDIARDRNLVRLLGQRGAALRRLIAEERVFEFVADRNLAALCLFPLTGRQNAAAFADWAGRVLAKKSRRLLGRPSSAQWRKRTWS